MPRASKTEKADTPAKPTKPTKPTKPAKAPAKDPKPATTVKSSKNDKPARSSTVRVATSSRARGREPPSPEAIDELARLWAEFKQSEVSGARESAREFGLIDALEKFDLGRGNKFETYAIPRIKGAIIDELRAMDWVPRSVRFKAREIEKAYSDLESIHKRAPTEKEVAARLGVTLRELHEVINQISFVQVVQLDEILSVGSDRGEQVSLIDTLADRGTDPTTSLEGQETRGMLAAAINSLSEREKIVVTLYYFEGLTLAEIGEILALTESRVCQIHTKAVGQLRLQLVETE
jgi:RNA polymerase sigma factor for flagellar operon FliA